MRRPRASRAFAVLFAVWFALVANQPQLYGACPMSGHTGAHPGAEAGSQDSRAGGMAMSMPMDGATRDMAPSGGSAPHHAPAQLPTDCCSGIAACCGAAALPTQQFSSAINVSFVAQPALLNSAAVRTAGAVDVVLPFANGPPARLAI